MSNKITGIVASIRNKKIWRLVHFITPFTGNIRLVYICVFWKFSFI